MTVSNYYQQADVMWLQAPNTSPVTNLNLPAISPFNFGYSVPYYTNKAGFDADFGPGDYEFDGTDTNTLVTDPAYVTLPTTEYYPSNIPAFTAESWNRMQQVDPAQNLSVNLNGFGVVDGGDLALTFIEVFNRLNPGGLDAYSTNNNSSALTNFVIPANTLYYGQNYEVDVYFSSRLVAHDAGFGGADGIVGFDYLTFADLSTIGPTLTIAMPGTNVAVNWPSLASNFSLQTSTNLSDPYGWGFVTNIVQPPGLTNTAVFPASDQNRFFRLTLGAP